ncbi:pyruvate kinase [Piscinibacter defluvii]|uniref:pyruvate kinase n=1 Tax=Piscinibacter defluvii TaxID=1796922 RepID=UPI000FDD7A7D|nr:pyruvate kinase [Piscinibacter defluvii]
MEHSVDTGLPREAAWERTECQALLVELQGLRRAMADCEQRLADWIAAVHPSQAASARNLAHYLAMRSVDARGLQDRLARLGLSSLGRAESHVMATLDKVIGLLHVLLGRPWQALADEPAGFRLGRALLEGQAQRLFGPPPPGRRVRMMVTLPAEAAHDAALVDALVHAGMDVARINCAHDDAPCWTAMAAQVRRAAAAVGRPVRVLMDLAGQKIRTGPVAPGPQVVKLRPQRDAFGRVTAPALLGLRARGLAAPVHGAQLTLGVAPEWLARLHPGDRVELVDARGAERRLTVVDERSGGVLLQCERSAYLTPQTRLRLLRHGAQPRDTLLADLPERPGRIGLQRGDTLRLLRSGLGHDASHGSDEGRVRPAGIACTPPEVLGRLAKGERVWFDDGRIGGVVRRVAARGVDVEITDIAEAGATLGADKGINLPDSRLELPALTPKDLADLDLVAQQADLVGLSFAQGAADVRALRAELARRGAGALGLVLKIETRRGFEHLPEMLFAAMAGEAAGVMIARGDLAVECGFERLAEVQEEILWACEAAHLPVVWATQVLEGLAKTGRPSRAEITDAAMGERAECVMLNKGPHILEAMHTLDDVLRRMEGHQSKKRPLLRALKAWGPVPG